MNKTKVAIAVITTLTGGSIAKLNAEPLLIDYQEATSAYEDAYVAGDFNLNSGNQEQTSYDLDLSIDYEKVFSSPDRNSKFDFLGAGSRTRGQNLTDETTSDYQALAAATVDNYFEPGSKAGFWYGKGELGAKKGQIDPFSKVTVGLGYGRVVNVTPMARAIRVIQELRKRGSLTDDPSDAIYQAVAEIVSEENEYRSKYGSADYEQFWIEAMEDALRTSGVVKGGGDLGAGAVLRSYDVLVNERISTRKFGWLVRAGVGAVITDYDGENGKPALEIGGEYHVPLSNLTQFSDEAMTHELTDRIDWENLWLINHNVSDTVNDITTNTLSSTFRYYLTNQLGLDITAKLEDIEDNIDNNGNEEIDKSLNLGIIYRLK